MDATDRYDSLIRWYASLYSRNPQQVKRQLRMESNFNPRAMSGAGAKGLAQFMDATWREWGDGADPYNAEASIKASCRYMAHLEQQLGHLDLALAAYNWGPGNVKLIRNAADWRKHLPAETRAYVERGMGFDVEKLL